MRTLSSDLQAAVAAGVVVVVQLVKLEFPSGTVALNTSTWDLVYGGITYRGAAGLGSISPIEDAPGEVRGLQFEISGVAASAISLAMDDADGWQGAPVTILTAILNASTYQIIDATVEFTGLGDTLSIQEDGETCAVSATAESSAVDLLRGVPVTYTDADQKRLFAGDRAFEFVVDQADKPVVWPAREFFFK